MGRRWPTGKSPDEGDKNNNRFYDENLSKLRVLQVKKGGLFSVNTKLLLSIFPSYLGQDKKQKIEPLVKKINIRGSEKLNTLGDVEPLSLIFLGAAG